MHKFIPYGRHCLDDDDIKSVEAVLRGDWLTCGSYIQSFEERICSITQGKYALACSNGTTALHLALRALGIGIGDKVIVPAITFLATANAVRYVGGNVIFADVDQATGLMTSQSLSQAIEKVTDKDTIKAVINVHLAGQCEDLEEIYQVAKSHKLFIIEDAAHAIGTVYIDKTGKQYPIGSNAFSDITTFSFHPVKTVATGEGGALTTNDFQIAEKITLLRSHGMIRNPQQWVNISQGFDEIGTPNPWYYEMQELGYNYRISDINCALGLSQLNKLGTFIERRQQLANNYDRAFSSSTYLKPLRKLACSKAAWHLYIVHLNFSKVNQTRAQVMQKLTDHNIGTQVHYIPLYKQPYYQQLLGPICLEGAEEYYRTCLSIPLFMGLTDEQQDYVIEILNSL